MNLKENQKHPNIGLALFENGTILKVTSYEGQDKVMLRKNDETSKHWLRNNFNVDKSSHRLNFNEFDSRNLKEDHRQNNIGSWMIWKFNYHLGGKLWGTGQHEVQRSD